METMTLPHDHGHNHQAEHLQEQLRRTERFSTVADVFRQLSDCSRLRIFWLLCHCEECVINISSLVEMSSPAVSHHLRQLKESGLVSSRRNGKEVYYRAADTEESRLLHLAIEKTMEISCPDGYRPGQIEIIKKIHDYLTQNLEQRMTIEELSKQFLMNPSTMKTLFKTVYGNSIAAHIREHRMEKAAFLLRESDASVADIARSVCYDSQSKFSAEFKKAHQMLPTEYRKKYR
ncbi:MAG: metalloregulator ArsR/SmtB family transcription factor [Clostridia bacterium]